MTDVAEDFFDSSFLAELEALAGVPEIAPTSRDAGAQLPEKLRAFLAPEEPGGPPLTEESFLALAPGDLLRRTNALVEICRDGGKPGAAQAVENFVVFFQALVPRLTEGASEVERVFFRLVPTLIHIAHNDFSEREEQRAEGSAALRNLETILIEISGVRLAPSEVDLVFRSIDHMSAFIGAGEYTMANEVISSQLLSIIARNKLTRALYRLMEVEVSLQRYLKARLGHTTPQLRVPEDIPALSEYGPIRVLQEETFDGGTARYVQVQLPDIPILRDIVLKLVGPSGYVRDLRFDALGSAPLDVPPGLYQLGLVYQPG